MKKILFALALLFVLLITADYSYAQCYAGELIDLSVSKDNNCESVEFWHYNQVSINSNRNFLKQGKFKFKFRKTGGNNWVNLPINFNVDTINGSVYTNEFKYSNNGDYRCIFYETGTGCKDTSYVTITVNKAPKPTISFAYTCYGGLFTIGDTRNPSGVGNTYEIDSAGGFWVPSNKTIPVTCNNCVWIVPVGGPLVKVTNSFGCSATTYWQGTIFNDHPPVYTISASQNPIGSGQTTTLTATSNYAVANFKWYRSGSTLIIGTDSTLNVAYPDTGKYKVRIRNTNAAGACVVNKFITIHSNAPLRLDESSYNDELVAYPNPANNLIQISGHEGQVEILNMLGKVIYSTNESDPVFSVDISALQSGIYLIRSGEKIFRFTKN
jgi:Secretion system C-terminal sorting domain/PKD domain